MGEAQELQLQVIEAQELNLAEDVALITRPPFPTSKTGYKWWLLVAFYIFFVLSGQTIATLLGRLYYNKGGNSKWMQTIVVTAGFPFLLPLLIYFSHKPSILNQINTANNNSPSIITLALLYAFFGIFSAGNNLMAAYGLLYLPVSTYSLVCATQLTFNVLFSYFLNSLKLTPVLLSSVVLLTISASLLALHSESDGSTGITKARYVIGFLCTLGSSALFSLLLSLYQLSFEKILKKETFSVILEMQIYPSIVATCVCGVGLFASGEWKSLKVEMEQIGGVSYVMIIAWIAVAWTFCTVGALGLIFEVSSLFANVISTTALPIIPIFGVIFFHDKMDGLKVVALILALWGFISYTYQNYLDHLKLKALTSLSTEASESSNILAPL
ncbi:hypothetical protein NE237_029004 [Protea cynaroides]|uniref:Probable purine permease n=1 Tax=Protea cynaroides TaxID=273540 RepID=A0A9Q0JUN8_9MAGN|nr:hypothetical protein NE237_029004 [Protea cynaroides]